MHYLIKLSYRGSDFHGWQRQQGQVSVQQSLEEALSVLLKEQIRVTGAGRTDTGVNALRYVAHFDAAKDFDCKDMIYKLNAILPRAVAVEKIVPAQPSFNARFDALEREYRYFLHRKKDPFAESYSYLYAYPDVDFGKMNRCAALLVGKHDFRCFEKAGSDTKTSICTVFEAGWQTYRPEIAASSEEDAYWYFRISADRFLRNMVRSIVGTLLEVGRGRRSEEDFASLILDEDYSPVKSIMLQRAGESVPGQALFLYSVRYREDF